LGLCGVKGIHSQFVAIVIGNVNERKRSEREEETLYHNAQGVAVAVYPDLLRIIVSRDAIMDLLHPTTGLSPDVTFNAARAAFGLHGAKFVIPFMLQLNLKRLH
jgi:hypothetical protein